MKLEKFSELCHSLDLNFMKIRFTKDLGICLDVLIPTLSPINSVYIDLTFNNVTLKIFRIY